MIQKKATKYRFLESITFMGNDVLIPIKNIRTILCRANANGYEIVIQENQSYEWIEHFDNINNCEKRYKQIKNIINAK